MKILSKITALGALALALATPYAKAGENTPEEANKPVINGVYTDAGLFSRYLGTFGFTLSKGPVMQSDIGFNVGPIEYNIWNNLDEKKGSVNEIDNSLGYTYSTKNFDFRAGVIYFTFPDSTSPDAITEEYSLKTKNLPINLKLYFSHAHGETSNQGNLGQITLDKTLKLSQKISLSLEGRVTYNDYFFTSESGITHVAAQSKVNFDLGKGFTLTPSLSAQRKIDGIHGIFKNRVVFGINLNKKF